jgi:elongation factor G
LIDVPGYPDFIGDLHGVARVVEAMIIVCEAKADLDVGFDLAWEAAEEHGLARCIFVNKLERDNADYKGLIDTLHKRYGTKIVNVQMPIGSQAGFTGVVDLLDMKAYNGKDRAKQAEEIPAALAADAEALREKVVDAAAEADDELALKYLEGEALSSEEVQKGLLKGIQDGHVVPVLIGSAHSGAGAGILLDRIVGLLPSPKDAPKQLGDAELSPNPDAPLVGFVFKSTADPYVGKINYVRVFATTF